MENRELQDYVLPEWSLSYLVNGDRSCLSDDEVKLIDEWYDKERIMFIAEISEESFFCHKSCIGTLGSTCYTVKAWRWAI